LYDLNELVTILTSSFFLNKNCHFLNYLCQD